ncbi:MAG TPA: ACT domain-containing protein [Acidimicrobiales bacterium]|nr:ACT domain-containing protein [Acidimicrobiales bacterium]
MARYLLRVWLPDRPGALGAVASRIGALRGDVLGLEVLEREGGVAVDELDVELPSEELIPLLLREIAQVDGCGVEECRRVRSAPPSPVRVIADLVGALEHAGDPAAVPAALAEAALEAARADWVLVVQDNLELASAGPAPHPRWTAALCAGLRCGSLPGSADRTVGVASLGPEGPDLVVGRAEHPLRSAELEVLDGLATVAGARLRQLAMGEARAQHPSGAMDRHAG